MLTITLEEHITLPQISGRIDKNILAARGYPVGHSDNAIMQKAALLLPEVGDQRIASMDEAGIDLQILSVAGPGAELLPAGKSITFAMDYNDAIAGFMETNPGRFGGFAHLPMTESAAAAIELERAVKDLKFSGALINGTTENLFLDDPRFAPILAKAQELGVPLYLHPSFPPPAVQESYYSRLSPLAGAALSSAAFGWHAEVAIHVLRLIAAGTLDKYPKLQIIVGHMGEMLPFMMARTEAVLAKEVTKSTRTVSEILKSQVSITTSGFFTLPPLMTAIETFGIERILFSVDYPFSPNMKGRQFLNELALTLKPEEVGLIASGNAKRLLKLPVIL